MALRDITNSIGSPISEITLLKIKDIENDVKNSCLIIEEITKSNNRNDSQAIRGAVGMLRNKVMVNRTRSSNILNQSINDQRYYNLNDSTKENNSYHSNR